MIGTSFCSVQALQSCDVCTSSYEIMSWCARLGIALSSSDPFLLIYTRLVTDMSIAAVQSFYGHGAVLRTFSPLLVALVQTPPPRQFLLEAPVRLIPSLSVKTSAYYLSCPKHRSCFATKHKLINYFSLQGDTMVLTPTPTIIIRLPQAKYHFHE